MRIASPCIQLEVGHFYSLVSGIAMYHAEGAYLLHALWHKKWLWCAQRIRVTRPQRVTLVRNWNLPDEAHS